MLPLGEFLIERALIRHDQLETALREQKRSRRFLGDILLALGFIKRTAFYPALAEHLGLPFVDLSLGTGYHYDPNGWVQLTPNIEDDKIHIAVSDPQDAFIQLALRQNYPNRDLVFYLADPKAIEDLSYSGSVEPSSRDYAPDLLRDLITQAVDARASDLHFMPSSRHCQVLLRLDGVLIPLQTLHADQWQGLCAHIKVLGHLDLAESRRPQDGAFRFFRRSDPVDCRVSVIPVKEGESIVIRLLNPESIRLSLEHLGFTDVQAAKLKRIAHLSDGLFIITGPTGSGKTTTLYSILQEIIPSGRNVMTLEQPVEYRLDGVRQTEIQEDVLSFSDVLRSVLRHDPDVIYISEIRDAATAMIAVRAAMTGHLVLTTLHVGDVRLVPQRLEDLGVPPGYLSGVLKGGMSQRLIRLQCSGCLGDGCSSCLDTGYYGRHVIAEIFADGDDLNSQYQASRFERMAYQAQQLVAQNRTSQPEVQRVLGTLEQWGIHAA